MGVGASSEERWVLVWDPLEITVHPGGQSIPLACWCELHLVLRDREALREYLGKSTQAEVSRDEVKNRCTHSLKDLLRRQYTRKDWREATLVQRNIEKWVTTEMAPQVPPGLEIEKFLIRSICPWEEYLSELALRADICKKIQELSSPGEPRPIDDPQAQRLLEQVQESHMPFLTAEERQQSASYRLQALQKLCQSDFLLANKYRVDSKLGQGGMGIVYKAWDVHGERWVAIKLLPERVRNDPNEIEEFRRSFQRVQALYHPSICPVLVLDHDDRVGYFLVMQYVEGVDLSKYRSQYLQNYSPGSQELREKVIALLRPVAEALDYSHQQGVIHRDMKPSNILVVVENDEIQSVQVIDFGLAAAVRNTLSRLGDLPAQEPAGTPAFMPPEQWQGNSCAKSDQYSLAVVAYELLSGKLPFENENLWLLRLSIFQDDPPPLKDYPDGVNKVLMRALAKQPEARYPTCGKFVDELEKALLPKEEEKPEDLKQREERKERPEPGPGAFFVSCLEGDWLDWVWEGGAAGRHEWTASGLPVGWQCRSWGGLFGVAPLGSCWVSISAARSDGTPPVPLSVEIKSLRDFFTELGFQEIEPGVLQEPPTLGKSEFCCVPGGFFLLGYHPNPQRTDWVRALRDRGFRIDDEVARQEWPSGIGHCNSFLISRFKITNQQYAEFVQAVGGHRPSHWADSRCPKGTERHPVTNISYEDAQAYCEWKTHKAQEAGLGIVYRLPTHWEWEKAARGACTSFQTALTEATQPDGPGRIYPWGDSFQDTFLNSLSGRGPAQLQDVDVFMAVPTPWKVCELVGNAYEWVDGGRLESHGIYKCLRGVAWDQQGECQGLTFYRAIYADSDVRRENIGFRCVISIDRKAPLQQVCVPLGNCEFIDGSGRKQIVNYRFGLARFAVTNEEFREFRPAHQYPPREARCPVVNVSWQEARDFCRWKSQKEGQTYRLPMHHEWELACRGLAGRKYPWGDAYSPYWCNSLESGWGRPVDVDSLPQGASPEGIYHLCGNVFEWLSNGEAVGGGYNATCNTYGAPPYPNGANGSRDGRPFIGFRYVTILPL